MSTPYPIPLQVGTPQTFGIQLGSKSYQLTFAYRNDLAGLGGWFMDIADAIGNALVSGIAVVTGCDLLGPYQYLGFGGAIVGQTTDNPDALPTFDNFGDDFQLYWVTVP
jgi:hypothetical protein